MQPMWHQKIAGRTLEHRVICMVHLPIVGAIFFGALTMAKSDHRLTVLMIYTVISIVVNQVNPIYRIQYRISWWINSKVRGKRDYNRGSEADLNSPDITETSRII